MTDDDDTVLDNASVNSQDQGKIMCISKKKWVFDCNLWGMFLIAPSDICLV